MQLSPLFVKYRTENGNPYLYDPSTNEIVRSNDTVYEIIDDYHVLTTDEIVTKYSSSIDEPAVRSAIQDLDEIQSRGILCDETPHFSARPKRVHISGKEQSFEDFHSNNRSVLVLELTQQCNLRCEYCCYGTYYDRFREHNPNKMTFERAKNAVDDFLSRKPHQGFICFYGGEAFLEYKLMQQIIEYSEQSAEENGVEELGFSVTTNGTILGDEKIHYLVKHNVSVNVSLDGDKETHDRFRVFRNERNPDERIGSFDIIWRNLRRFQELYPDYKNCSLSITLTARADLDGANQTLIELGDYFFPRVHFVQDIQDTGDRATWEGCAGPRQSCCDQKGQAGTQENPVQIEGFPSEDSGEEESKVEFCDWENADFSGNKRFFELLAETDDVESLREKFPLYTALFVEQRSGVHNREILRRPEARTFANRCYLGASRSFVSAKGDIYPCERTETSGSVFKLGKAEGGAKVSDVNALAEVFRLLGDCANCIANKFCSQCPATVREKDGKLDAVGFQRGCRDTIAGVKRMLIHYTSLMERNPTAVDKLLLPPQKSTWVSSIGPVATEEQVRDGRKMRESLVGVEKLSV